MPARSKAGPPGMAILSKNTRPWCQTHDCLFSRCQRCAAERVHGAGADLCQLPGHATRKGALPRKFACSHCIRAGLCKPRIKHVPLDPDVEYTLLLCDLENANSNAAGGKGYEVKKLSVSDRLGYKTLTGPIVQAVSSTKQYIDASAVISPTQHMKQSSGAPKGRCKLCAPQPGVLGYVAALPAVSAPGDRLANWALGTIWFEPGNHEELFIPRQIRPGRHASETCACAWLYDTRPLEDLFRGWRPRNREKHNCISFLAHYAWTTSRGEAMNAKDRPGYLRAHKIVSKKRFARPQPWSTPRNMSGCSLRRGARPDAWAV
jgi:hypothetical protein